jgi:hypothetical protein
MKTREWVIEDGGWNTRSVLSVSASLRRDRAEAAGEGGECGDTSPLSPAAVGRVTPCAPVVADSHQEQTARRGRSRPASLTLLLACFILLHSSFCLRALGQSYTVDWYKIAGGGGTSTGGPVTGTNYYSVSGTIGQPDASGAMTGGNYSLTGGFWSLVDVVQTPGAPTLYISHSGNTVTVCWQAVSGWNLIQSGNLTTPMGSWSASSGITTSNGTNAITLTPPVGNLFFRLQQ